MYLKSLFSMIISPVNKNDKLIPSFWPFMAFITFMASLTFSHQQTKNRLECMYNYRTCTKNYIHCINIKKSMLHNGITFNHIFTTSSLLRTVNDFHDIIIFSPTYQNEPYWPFNILQLHIIIA